MFRGVKSKYLKNKIISETWPKHRIGCTAFDLGGMNDETRSGESFSTK